MPYTVAIRGKGTARTGGRTVTAESFALLRVYTPAAPASGTPAAYSNYVIFSNRNGEIKDKVKVYGHPELGGKGVYINGQLKFKGKPEVRGDIRITGKFKDLRKVGPWPPGAYKREQRVGREPMPVVDLAYYRSIADEIHVGDLKIDGRKHTNTSLQKPRVIFVDGKVELKGKLEGCGLIIATKEVKIAGDVTYGSKDSAWAIISAGKVSIKDDAEVHGGIYAHSVSKKKGSASVSGSAKVFGFLVADQVKVKKNAVIEYDPLLRSMSGLPGGLGATPVVDVVFWGSA
jgi:uncharacterized Zn-binding protein involved in type VI secretion